LINSSLIIFCRYKLSLVASFEDIYSASAELIATVFCSLEIQLIAIDFLVIFSNKNILPIVDFLESRSPPQSASDTPINLIELSLL
jgi:hypothetical protein